MISTSTPLQRYDLAIEALTAQLDTLQRANPSRDLAIQHQLRYLTSQRETLVSNRYKLRAALEAEATYSEQITTHGKESYSGALVIARRAVQHYERLAPDEAELAQGE